MLELPNSWAAVKLGDFVGNEKGKKPKNESKSETTSHPIPYVDIQAFEENVVRTWTDGVGCRLCYETDFLMVWDGSRSGLVGKGMNGALGSTLVRIYFPSMVNDYAFYFLQSKYQQINTRAKGVGIPHVDPGLLWNYDFPIAPLNEQHRIVAKIEELFSELDKGIENLKTARAQLKVYRQALLKHAFEGKLTAQWRAKNQDKLETADALLKRIQQARAQRHQQQLTDWEAAGKQGSKPKAPKPLPPLTAEELAELPEQPEGWGRIRIGNLLDVVSGNTPKGIENTKGTEIPYYRVSDMNRVGNEVSMNSSATYLSDREAADIGLNILPVGTIIFPKRGGAIATNKKRRLAHRSCFDLNLMGLTNLPTSLSAGYLWLWMLALDLASISDGSNVPQINNRNVEPLAFPICSPDEQALIVELAESRLSVCDQLDQTLATSLQQAESLRQSILKKAFSGQLVPQDPHDEPASRLLARIKAERATVAAKPRKSSTSDKLSPVGMAQSSLSTVS